MLSACEESEITDDGLGFSTVAFRTCSRHLLLY